MICHEQTHGTVEEGSALPEQDLLPPLLLLENRSLCASLASHTTPQLLGGCFFFFYFLTSSMRDAANQDPGALTSRQGVSLLSFSELHFSFCSAQTPSAVSHSGTFTGGGSVLSVNCSLKNILTVPGAEILRQMQRGPQPQPTKTIPIPQIFISQPPHRKSISPSASCSPTASYKICSSTSLCMPLKEQTRPLGVLTWEPPACAQAPPNMEHLQPSAKYKESK